MRVTLTTAGQALLDANTGPITVTSYKLGSAFGYVPQPADTNIHGTLIYTGLPSAPLVANANVVKYSAYLDYNLGPFAFGEIGLFVGTTLFALATGDELVQKVAITGTSTGNAIRIDEYLSVVSTNYAMWLDLSTSNNEFQMAILGSVDQLPPSAQATPNAYIISGATSQQSAYQAYTDKSALWNFDAYQYANQATATITSFTSQSVTIALTDYIAGMTPAYFGQVILQFSTGALYSICRYVLNTVTSGSFVTLNFHSQLMLSPVVGDKVVVFGRQALSTTNPNIPVASHTQLGGVIIGTTLTVNSGLIDVDTTQYPVQSVNGLTGAVVVNASNITGFAAVAYSGLYSALIGAPAAYTLPFATTTTLGGVKAPTDSNLTVAGDGTIDLGFPPVKSVNGVQPDGSGNVTLSSATIGLVNPARIVASTDFNTLITTGLYFGLDADAPSFVNAPITSTGGVLDIEPFTTTATGGDLIQRYTTLNTMYFRRYTKTTSSWSSWVAIATSASLPIATTGILGAVVVGAGLNVSPTGTLSTQIQSVNGKTDQNIVLAATDVGAIATTQINAPGGVPSLDNGADPYVFGRIPFYENTLGTWWNAGTWDASVNHVIQAHTTDTVVDTSTSLITAGKHLIDISYDGTVRAIVNPDYQTVAAEGAVYRVIVAGTTNLDGYNQWDVDDLAVCVLGKWVKITINFTNVVFSAGTF